MRRLWGAAALAWAGCVGPPLPAQPPALEAELRARVEMLRSAFPAVEAGGSIVIDGPERVKLGWRLQAVRGDWARLVLASSLAGDPVVEARVGAGEGLAVRVSPPGAPATLYRSPSDDISRLPLDGPARPVVEWLVDLARDHDLAMPPPSRIQVTEGSARLEFAHGPLVSRVTLRRSDSMPVDVEWWVRGESARACLRSRPRGDRALRVAGTPLGIAGDLESTVSACCDGKASTSIRLAVAHLSAAPAGPPPRWSEPARPIEHLRDDRWLRRTLRDVEAARNAALQACADRP